MQAIATITVPFFAIIFFGYLAARLRWVPTEAVPAFNGFLLYFAVPAMLFRFAADTPFEQLLNGRFALAWALCGVVVVLGVAFALRRMPGVAMRDAAFLGLTGGVG